MDNTEEIRKRYDRVSRFYDIFEQPMEIMALKRWRREVTQDLNGRVLEVGVGTGKNIPYYPDDIDIIAIDFSDKMLSKAKERVKKLNTKVELIWMFKIWTSLTMHLTWCLLPVCFALFLILLKAYKR